MANKVKVLVSSGKQEETFEFNKVHIEVNIVVGERPGVNPNMVERYPIGKPITLIMGDMPSDLKDSIMQLVYKYCNH